MSQVVTKKQIVDDLKSLGLVEGEVVIVHSALASLGKVEGGAETVIEALLEVLGESGTLMMPAFAGPFPFDIKNTPSGLGIITETFRKYPGVKRSFHPSHSVCVIGPKADELIADHIKSPSACGLETPYGRLCEMGGKILLLGVDNDRNTILHTLEEYAGAVYLSDREFAYLDENGEEKMLKVTAFPGPHRDFIGLDSLLSMAEVMTIGKVGGAVARLIDAKGMIEVGLEAFEDSPDLVLCDNPSCGDCVMQRRKIRLAELAKEDFVLSALSSTISPYPFEIAEEMNAPGIYDLVVDKLFGLPVWKVAESKLKLSASVFAEQNIIVSSVVASADFKLFDVAMNAADLLGAKTIIVPLASSPKQFVDAAADRGFGVMFENTILTASMCVDLLKGEASSDNFAFNPANFTLAGENPFLSVFGKSKLRQRVGLLYLSDVTTGGCYTLPGEGNSEVKELVSILRCRSFNGRIVIATGPGGPEFCELVDAFWLLMETL